MPAPREPFPVGRPAPLTEGQLRARRWAQNGALLGLFLGAIFGLMFIGARIREWGFGQTAMTVAMTSLGGLAIGYLAVGLAMGGLTAGGAHAEGQDASNTDGGSSGATEVEEATNAGTWDQIASFRRRMRSELKCSYCPGRCLVSSGPYGRIRNA